MFSAFLWKSPNSQGLKATLGEGYTYMIIMSRSLLLLGLKQGYTPSRTKSKTSLVYFC